MRYILSLLLIITISIARAQNCTQLPKSFSTYQQAVRTVKSSAFTITESVNTGGSSWMASADYYSCDGLTGYFIYTTNRGYEYIHKGVPIAVWKGFKAVSSKGGYYNANIKDRYQLPLD